MSAVTAFSQMYPDLLIQLPVRAESNVVIPSLRRAAIRFCNDSKSLVQNLTAISTVAGQLSYTLTAPTDTEIIEVKRVGIRTAEQIALDSDADGQEISSLYYKYSPKTGKIKFSYAPASTAITNGLLIAAVLRPLLGSDGLPTWFMNLYRDGLIAGAIFDICTQPRTPFWNPEVARRNEAWYHDWVSRAVRDVEVNYTHAPNQISGGYALL